MPTQNESLEPGEPETAVPASLSTDQSDHDELDDDGADRDVPVRLPPRPGGRANGSIVMAAMVGISEALGFDKQQEQVVEASAASGEGLDLDFGDLPPLS